MKRIFTFLFFLIFTLIDVTAEDLTLNQVIERMKLADEKIKTIRFDYSQDIDITITKQLEKITGYAVFKKPNKFFIQHTKPQQQTVISDGKKISFNFPAYDQTIIQDIDSASQDFAIPKGIFDFGKSIDEIKKNYEISLLRKEDDFYLINLIPKQAKEVSIRLWVKEGEWFPLKTEMKTEMMKITTTLKNIKNNVPVNEKLFRIKDE